MHVRRAGLDLAVVGRRVQVQVLAHEARVVGAAAHEVGRHADDVPVGGELLRVARVQPQRAAAHLLHRHAGGGDGEVDEAVDHRAVPALAEQRARADQRAADAALEHARGQLHPRARDPLGARRAQRDQHAVRARPPSRAARGAPRPARRAPRAARRRRPAGSAARGRRPRAAAAAPCASRRRRAISAWRAVPAAGSSTPPSSGSGLASASSASHSTSARSASPRDSISARQHLDEPERLRLRAGQQPVDLRRAAADPAARELEAELGRARPTTAA